MTRSVVFISFSKSEIRKSAIVLASFGSMGNDFSAAQSAAYGGSVVWVDVLGGAIIDICANCWNVIRRVAFSKTCAQRGAMAFVPRRDPRGKVGFAGEPVR